MNAILEKEHALSELKRHEYEQLREKADNSNVRIRLKFESFNENNEDDGE